MLDLQLLPKTLNKSTVKPIFHQAFVGRVGAENAIYFALGTSKISISPTKILFFEKVFA